MIVLDGRFGETGCSDGWLDKFRHNSFNFGCCSVDGYGFSTVCVGKEDEVVGRIGNGEIRIDIEENIVGGGKKYIGGIHVTILVDCGTYLSEVL